MLLPGGVGTRLVALIVLALIVIPGAAANPLRAPTRLAETLDNLDPLGNGPPDAPRVPPLPDTPDEPEVPAIPEPNVPRGPFASACARVWGIPIGTSLVEELGLGDEVEAAFDDARHLHDECRALLA